MSLKQGVSLVSFFLFCFLLAFVSGSLFFTIGDSKAESKQVEISAKINSVLAITTDANNGELLLDIMPTPSGTLAKNDLTVSVSTNNPTGYTLSMNSVTTNTSMVHEAATGTPPAPNIPSTTNPYNAPAALGMNTWGWNLGTASSTTTFSKIPALGDSQTVRTTADLDISSSDTIITFAANVGSDMSSGSYTNTILFTAISNYVPPPPAIPPLGSYPTNIDPTTNPGVKDVYPTTGWGGEVVMITSNNQFTNVNDVKIGGTSCAGWSRINNSVIACKLPNKTHGSTHNIEVLNGAAPGTDVILTATYKHMKVTYFDPNQTTITFQDTATFGSSNFTYYPGTNPGNTFSSTDCAGLDPDNTNNINIPNSIVFVRDIRNNQVYRVKKMVDNKCWMIDNLKYQGPTDRDGAPIQNYDGYQGNPITDGTTVSDGTAGSTGLVFRNGRGPNLPTAGTIATNTIDGSSTQSATNSNKAFWNNPMSHVVCYSGLYSGNPIMDANTLTHCGYFYNWFAATGGTGTYDGIDSITGNNMATSGHQARGSICPANFRLPSGTSNDTGGIATGDPTSNGTGFQVADFSVLNASMNAGILTTGATTSTFFAGWEPGAQWSGVFSGEWFQSIIIQGDNGRFWSSTARAGAGAHALISGSTSVSPGGNVSQNRYSGFAVRCVMP